MKTQRISLLVGLLCLLASLSVGAASRPVITGTINGWEFCAQSIPFCGQASFFGTFTGTVNKKWTSGLFLVGVTHGGVPETGTSPITGGSWMIRTEKDKEFAGVVTGGTLTANGDNTFGVVATLEITSGGHGTLTFSGVLNHNVFPPTIVGEITQ